MKTTTTGVAGVFTESERLLHRLVKALERDGFKPDAFFELLAAVVDRRTWEDTGHASLIALLDDQVGRRTWELAVKYFHHTAEVAERPSLDQLETKAKVEAARKALKEAIPPLADHGANQHSSGVDDIKSSGGSDPSYIVSRLKRDHPELAEQVASGELTANAAAVRAGFRPRTATVRLDDPKRAAATLRKKLTVQQRQQLAAYLIEDA